LVAHNRFPHCSRKRWYRPKPW